MKSKNLIELISEVRPRSALFTTYTLSISFIESVLLPTLRHVGCNEVAIIADANELANSLEETQARGAGRRYRLAPLLAPNGGIFHPKLAYFTCEDHDIIAVGSGNLTVSGQSKQLECLDAVTSSDYPAVFSELSAMAAKLAHAVSTSSRQATTLLQLLAQRAKEAGGTPSLKSQKQQDLIRLVHTLDQSAAEQLTAFWSQQGVQAAELTVLSPFHAPDATPLMRLCASVGAKRLNVGLDPVTLVAPFTTSAEKTLAPSVSFVIPKHSDVDRQLHAKVFEVTAPNVCLVLTGSLNATAQSFESLKNIEVSLARIVSKSPFEWAKTEPAEFKPNKFAPQVREEDFAFLDASMNLAGQVQGVVYRARSLPERATASIHQFETKSNLPQREIDIASDGSFSFEVSCELGGRDAVQLSLNGNGLDARCWLNLEEELTATDQERREKQAVRHILTGKFSDEDVLELFQILTRAMNPQFGAKQQAAEHSKVTTSLAESSPDGAFSFLKWERSGANARTGMSLHGAGQHEALQAFMRWIYSDNQARERNERGHRSEAVTGNDVRPKFRLTDSDETSIDGGTFAIEENLKHLIVTIPEVLQRYPLLEFGPTLALVAGAHALKLALAPRWTDARAYQPLRHWLETYSGFSYAESNRARLLRFSLGAACVVVAIGKRVGTAAPFAALKDQVLRFETSYKDHPPTRDEVTSFLQDEVFSLVDPELKLAAVEALEEVWSAKSLDNRLEELVAHALDPTYSATAEDEAMFPGGIAAVRAIAKVSRTRRYHGVIQSQRQFESRGCPHCYQSFSEALLAILKANHLTACPNSFCRKAIFYIEDKSLTQRIMEKLQNA